MVNGIPPARVSWLVFVAFIAGLAVSFVAGWCNRTILSKESVEADVSFPAHHSVQNPLATKITASTAIGLVGRHPVDLVFVVGCTASMGQWIGMLTSAIHPLAAALRARFGDTEIRFGFVGFRDYAAKQDHKRFEIAELTDHFDALRAFLSLVQSVSPPHDDGPDDITGAMEKCTELHWGESTRVVLVLTDTPCHGTRYHSGMPDHFPAGDPSGLDPEQIVREMSRNDVHLYFGRIAPETDQMTAILRNAYESTAGRWSKFGAMDATSWASDPSRFVDTIVDLVTRSVSHTVRHHRENQLRPPGRGGQGGDKPDGTDPPRTETAGWRDYAQRLHSHQGHPAQAPKVPLPVDRLRSRALAASAFGNKMRPPGVPQTGPAASVPAELIGRVAPMSQRPPPPPPPSDGSNDGAPAPPPRPVPQTAL